MKPKRKPIEYEYYVSLAKRKEFEVELEKVREISGRITKSPATAFAFLLKHGFITKDGKLAKRYR